MPDILAIENVSSPFSWSEGIFLRAMRQRDVLGSVVMACDTLAGYAIYRLAKKHIEILNLAVAPAFRRRGVGRFMLDKLEAKLSSGRRVRVGAMVAETNVPAQLWLRACGYYCESQHKADDDDAWGYDIYCFAKWLQDGGGNDKNNYRR